MTTTTVPTWTLTDRLHKARKVAGLTFEQLAERLEVSDKTVRRMESGETECKRVALIGWAVACGVDVAWLITGKEDADAVSSADSLCYTRDCDTVLVAQIPGQMSLQVAA